jgi:hypothetical protein
MSGSLDSLNEMIAQLASEVVKMPTDEAIVMHNKYLFAHRHDINYKSLLLVGRIDY